MKLGTGNNKYKIKFKYKENSRIAIKNVYADSLEEAKTLFKEKYMNYNVEIIATEKLEENK